MRHGVKKARLGRPADQRKALVRGLVTEVLRHGKITTTKVRPSTSSWTAPLTACNRNITATRAFAADDSNIILQLTISLFVVSASRQGDP